MILLGIGFIPIFKVAQGLLLRLKLQNRILRKRQKFSVYSTTLPSHMVVKICLRRRKASRRGNRHHSFRPVDLLKSTIEFQCIKTAKLLEGKPIKLLVELLALCRMERWKFVSTKEGLRFCQQVRLKTLQLMLGTNQSPRKGSRRPLPKARPCREAAAVFLLPQK